MDSNSYTAHSYPKGTRRTCFMQTWEWVKYLGVEGKIKSEKNERKRKREGWELIWRRRVKEYKEELNSTNPYVILLVHQHIVTSNSGDINSKL